MISFKRNLISKYCLKSIKGFDEYSAMRHKYILLAFVIGISGLLVACGGGGAGGGKETVCDLGLKPKISSNAPLGQNDTLRLSVFGIDEPKTYTWEGPGGYVSHERAPVIPNPPKGSQTYTLSVVTNGGCTYTATSDKITITGPWNPCGLDSNVLKIVKATTMSFNLVTGMVSGSNYLIRAESKNLAICDFQFPGNQPPTEGTYTIQVNDGVIAPGRVRIVSTVSSLQPFYGASGTVYVAINGTTTMVSFCGVNFTSSNAGVNTTTAGANIMWMP
ncbi:hypothetical protein Cpin_2276 [Chitinophaga pinensis DSM 2588]|uniref:Ig-like domain-containing protein n=2 Tax=Chitinophaga pinensis TaxID=79329 RepID=A0A979GNP3_CHIPD|nr:hypothetical protein Cpin_2276 [Chitinophaga pinensis DSM 2588]